MVSRSVSCSIINPLPGLGDPVFDKLQADLAKGVLSIGTAKAIEFGIGARSASMKGSEYNDPYLRTDQGFSTLHNHAGGIQGGISTGENINFKACFSPISSVLQQQNTIDKQGDTVSYAMKGRHDICIIPRLVPIVEAMTALTIADHYLRLKAINTRDNY